MSVAIRGLGTVTPRQSITQDRAAELVANLLPGTERQRLLLAEVYRQVGVQSRHSVVLSEGAEANVARQGFYESAEGDAEAEPSTAQRMTLYEAHAGPLAIEASRLALTDADLGPDEITHLVTVSCSGFCAPGFDVALINELPLKRSVVRSHVGFMGCHGALNALGIARAFALADPHACVLVVAVELCSLHHQYGWHRDQLVANALFADGAAAVVVVNGDVPHDPIPSPTPRPHTQLCIAAAGSVVLADSLDLMSWRIGDHGFQMTLSGKVPSFIEQHLRPWLTGWLENIGRDLSEIGGWAIHPGGPRILQACETALGLNEPSLQHSRDVLKHYGNMSSPTVLFILSRLRDVRPPTPWLLLGFGPGLTIEALLLDS